MASFPPLNASGVITQYPYTESANYATVRDDLECGKSYTRSLAPNPTRLFRVTFSVGSKDEVAVWETFFNNQRGRFGEFDFTDDAGNLWPKCRFDQDVFDVQYISPVEWRITLLIRTIPS